MIDVSERDARVREAGASSEVGMILLDLVLGRAAHPDPARSLASAIRDARACAERDGRSLTAIASVVGTERDSQGLTGQVARLDAAGVVVLPSSAAGRPRCVARAASRAGGDDAGWRAVSLASLLGQPLRVVNVGLELFARELEAESVVVVHVDWRPPSGAPNVAALLARLGDDAS